MAILVETAQKLKKELQLSGALDPLLEGSDPKLLLNLFDNFFPVKFVSVVAARILLALD